MIDNTLYTLSQNQRRLLDLIRDTGKISRAELAVEIGLTAGAVTRQIKELLLLGLVEEGERRSGLRGQPALPLSLRSDGAYSIGLSFSLYEIEAIAIDFCGQEVASLSHPFACENAEDLVVRCSTLVSRLLKTPSLKGQRILGVGIALPGYFQPGALVMMDTVDALAMLRGVDLDMFRKAFDRETWIENNSTAASLAEFYNRPDVAVRDLAFVNVGYGFSAGLVFDGQLYRGRGGNAGDIGQFYPRGTPRPSALDLVNTLNASGYSIASMQDLTDSVLQPNAVVDAWIERAGEQIAHVMMILDSTIAPDEIVLGGVIPKKLLDDLLHRIRLSFQQLRQPPLSLRVSALGTHSSAVGAAYLPIHQTCSPRLGTVP